MPDCPSIPDIAHSLATARRVILLCHLRPDGDAYGSSLGLAHLLQQQGVETLVYNEDGLVPMYAFLPGSEQIQRTPKEASPADLIVSLDTSTQERLGPTFNSWGRQVDFNLDHHVSNTSYARHNLIRPDLPATAALVQELAAVAGWPLSTQAASCLFVGLSTDTGSFRYRGTTAQTFHQAAALLEAGADSAELSRLCYQSMSRERFALLRLAYASLVTECNDSLAYYTLTPEMFEQSSAKPEDTEGIVESSLLVDSIQLGALFEHKRDGSLKVSLRSKGRINVSQIASSFGGGGHPGAAGINFPSQSQINQEKVLQELRRALNS
ncbi:MAG: bifunctional oligoribonuclease/PAP phosphatase NrnA [Blastochloris sp.]|nr:bifunctional oligoribonuclease/PAP phosphatase NrnA [Blastochloris sp.]